MRGFDIGFAREVTKGRHRCSALARAVGRRDVDNRTGKAFRPAGFVQGALPLGAYPGDVVVADDAVLVRVRTGVKAPTRVG